MNDGADLRAPAAGQGTSAGSADASWASTAQSSHFTSATRRRLPATSVSSACLPPSLYHILAREHAC